jgi:hypothetical protein
MIAAPLSKKSLNILSSDYLYCLFDAEIDIDRDYFHRILCIGVTTLLITASLVNRTTSFISGYPLSPLKQLALGLTSFLFAAVAYVFSEVHIQCMQFPARLKFLKAADVDALKTAETLEALITILKDKNYPINEKLLAEVLSQCYFERKYSFLKELKDKTTSTKNWNIELEGQSYPLSYITVIAHLPLDQLYDKDPLAEKLCPNDYTDLGILKGRYDAKTIAFLIENSVRDTPATFFQKILRETYTDYTDRLITRGDIEAHFISIFFKERKFHTDEKEIKCFLQHCLITTAQGVGSSLSLLGKTLNEWNQIFTSIKNNTFQINDSCPSQAFDDLIVLAYFLSIRLRNKLFWDLPHMQIFHHKLGNNQDLFDEVAAHRHDPRVWAMFLDQMDSKAQESMFTFLEGKQLEDGDNRPITINMIREEMTPVRSEVITNKDLLVGLFSGLGTLVLSVAVVSSLILAQYSLAWRWTYPPLRGVVASAITGMLGYGVGKAMTGNDRIAAIAALFLSILAAPFLAKRYFNYEMGKIEASIPLLLPGLWMMKQPGRFRKKKIFNFSNFV